MPLGDLGPSSKIAWWKVSLKLHHIRQTDKKKNAFTRGLISEGMPISPVSPDLRRKTVADDDLCTTLSNCSKGVSPCTIGWFSVTLPLTPFEHTLKQYWAKVIIIITKSHPNQTTSWTTEWIYWKYDTEVSEVCSCMLTWVTGYLELFSGR